MKLIIFLRLCVILIQAANILVANDGVKLFLPPDLGTVKLGDPAYLPVTIVNYTDAAVLVPDLFYYSPKMAIEVTVDHPESIPFNSRFHGGTELRSRKLPARHAIRSVFALNLWHPREYARLCDSRKLTIKAYSLNLPTVDEPVVEVSDKSRILLAGSSLKSPETYLQASRRIVAEVEASGKDSLFYNSSQLNQYFAVPDFFVTWILNWSKRESDILDNTPFIDRASKTPEYWAIRERVVEGTALFRALRCAEIREFIEFGEEPLEERLAKGLKDFREVLSEARPAEYEFHVLSLRHVPANASGPDVRAKYREAFREAFPEVLAGMTDEGFLPAIPLPY